MCYKHASCNTSYSTSAVCTRMVSVKPLPKKIDFVLAPECSEKAILQYITIGVSGSLFYYCVLVSYDRQTIPDLLYSVCVCDLLFVLLHRESCHLRYPEVKRYNIMNMEKLNFITG